MPKRVESQGGSHAHRVAKVCHSSKIKMQVAKLSSQIKVEVAQMCDGRACQVAKMFTVTVFQKECGSFGCLQLASKTKVDAGGNSFWKVWGQS